MASISSNSKVTRSPSTAKTSKPPSGSAQSQHGAHHSAALVSAASDFDPSSSFFPHALPDSEAPLTSPRRARRWGIWLWPIAGMLLLAAGSFYYVQRPAQDRSAPDSHSAQIPAVEAAPSAKAPR